MLKKGALLLVITAMLMIQLPWDAYAAAPYDPTTISPQLLPSWLSSLSISLPLNSTSQSGPGGTFIPLGNGIIEALPIGIDGFTISMQPLSSNFISLLTYVKISQVTDAAIASRTRDNVSFVGLPFKIEAVNTHGNPASNFGLRQQSLLVDNEVRQVYTPTLEVVIPYNEEVIRSTGCGKEAGLGLYVWDKNEHVWLRMPTWVNTETNQLHIWGLHTMAGNIFRLGVLDSLPTIVLDPDDDVAYVNRTIVYGHTFPFVREGPLNIATAQRVRRQICDIADGCGDVITVELTYETLPGPSRSTRANRIRGWNPDVAVVIAYDADTHQVRATVPGGIKVLFVDRNGDRGLATRLVSALRSYYNRTHGNSTGLYAYQSSGPSGAGYYIGSYRMHPSVETDVALHSSIPIARVEVGMLSGYYNRLAIDSRQSVIASQIAAAIMNFLELKIGCIDCTDVDEFRIDNAAYQDSDAAYCVLRRLMRLVPLSSIDSLTATIPVSGDDFCGLHYYGYLNSNPPLPLFVEVNDHGVPIKIVKPQDAIIASIAIQMMGISDKVVALDYYELVHEFLSDSPVVSYQQISDTIAAIQSSMQIISTALSIGACTGLVSWLAKRCAGLESLLQYRVEHVRDLTTENKVFMETVLWYQIAQLSDQFLSKVQAHSPLELYQQIEQLGARNPLAPRIAVFAPDLDMTSCEAGEIPAGHTLFIVGTGQNGDDKFLRAVDPNTHERITIDIDEARDEWIFNNAPYTLPNGTRTWRGGLIYAVTPQNVPPYPIADEGNPDVNISFEMLSSNSVYGVGGYAAWFLGGFAPWFLGGDQLTATDYCIPITTAMASALSAPRAASDIPLVPSVRRFTTETLHLTYHGTSLNSNAFAETLFTSQHSIVLMGEANADTVNTLDLYPNLRGITLTTNMDSQMVNMLLVRTVEQGRANRIGNVRAITMTSDAPIAFYASPHNNIFILHNLSEHNKFVELFFGSVSPSGVTAYLTHSFSIAAHHIVSFTAWNWDNLSDTLFFAYDNDGTTVTPMLLQDVVRPTHIVFGKPSYVSGTVTYLTPQTQVSFDVMPATCGISATLYRLDGGEFQVYTQTFTLADLSEGPHTIEYYSVDNAGNVEPLNHTDLYLYNEPPLISIVLSGEVDSDGWYTPPVTITLLVTPTVLPVDHTSCQLRPEGNTFLYTEPFTVGNETSEIRCVVQDLAGMNATARTGIPIRKAQKDFFATGLGDPTMAESHMITYRDILAQLYERPGTVIQAQEIGLCNNVPMQPGDFHTLPTPPLGVPAEPDPNCLLTSRAMYGAPIGLFITGITDTHAEWEAPMTRKFLEQDLGLPASQIITLTEADIQAGKLNTTSIALLIIPAIEETFVESITARLGITGLQSLRLFAAEGGYIYASGGYAASALAEAGVISASAITTQSLIAGDNIAQVESQQPDSPLLYNWMTTTVYVPNGDLILTPTESLTAVARYSGTNAAGSAAILYGRYGEGEIVIANHHPLVPQDPIWYPAFIDVLFDSLDAPLSLLMQAEQQFNTDVPYDLLPAYEQDVPIRLTLATDYQSPISGTLQGLTVTLNPGFYFSPTENAGWHISSDGLVAMLDLTTSATLTQGRQLFTLVAHTAST